MLQNLKNSLLLFGLFVFHFSCNAQICPPGDITFYSQSQIDSFPYNYPGCTEINGSLTLNEFDNIDSLYSIKKIAGNIKQWGPQVVNLTINFDTIIGDILRMKTYNLHFPHLKYLGGILRSTTWDENCSNITFDSLKSLHAWPGCIGVLNAPILDTLIVQARIEFATEMNVPNLKVCDLDLYDIKFGNANLDFLNSPNVFCRNLILEYIWPWTLDTLFLDKVDSIGFLNIESSNIEIVLKDDVFIENIRFVEFRPSCQTYPWLCKHYHSERPWYIAWEDDCLFGNLKSNCLNALHGKVFFDENQNGVFDSLDQGISGMILKTENEESFFSGTDGNWFSNPKNGDSFEISIENPNFAITSDSSSYSGVFLYENFYNQSLDFGLYPLQTDPHYKLTCAQHNNFVCDELAQYRVDLQNKSLVSENFDIVIEYNEYINFDVTNSSIYVNDSINRSILVDLDSLYAYETRNLPILQMKIADHSHIGEIIKLKAYLYLDKDDPSSIVDSLLIESEIRCDFDDAEKQVSPVPLYSTNLTKKDSPLQYRINFFNDDIFWRDVILFIRDTFSNHMDFETFEVISSSHPVQTVFDKNNGSVSFNNIILKGFESGYVSYKIFPKADLLDSTLVENTASFYLNNDDVNNWNPKRTNTTKNNYVENMPQGPSGIVYFDENQNGIHDSLDQGIQGIYLNQEYNEKFLSGKDGKWYYDVPEAHHYSVSFEDSKYTLTSDSASYSGTSFHQKSSNQNLNFGVYPKQELSNFKLSLSQYDEFYCNQEARYEIGVFNESIDQSNFDLIIEYNDFIDFASSNSSIFINDTLTRSIQVTMNGVFAYENRILPLLRMRLANEEYDGEIIKLKAFLYLDKDDPSSLVDSFLLENVLSCTSDYNSKQLSPTAIYAENVIENNTPLQYRINFKNEENYIISNISIKDTISNFMDFETFEVISSSHNLRTEFDASNGYINFNFDTIFLEPEEFGFVTYKIHPKNNLPDTALVENTAFIYFDQNAPIITNTTKINYVDRVKILDTKNFDSESFDIFPNPASSTITLGSYYGNVQIYNISGILVKDIESNENENLNVAELMPGIYFVKIINPSGSRAFGKFVKQ